MKRYLWPNFVTSVWVFIGYCAFLFAMNATNVAGLDEQFGPFSARVALGPLAIAIIEGILWYRPFRFRESGWRVMAIFMAIVLFLYGLVVPLIVADLYEGSQLNQAGVIIFTYAAASHLLAALSGQDRS